MPEPFFGVILFSSVFALAFSGAALWVLRNKPGRTGREGVSLSSSFLAGSVTFSFFYILNRLFFPLWPKAAAGFNLVLLVGVFLFPVLKERVSLRGPRTGKKHRLYSEAVALEYMLKQDPLNAFCQEKLSEIYEQMGQRDRALEAAREAARLDPAMKNQWRVEDLEKESREKKRRRGGRGLS